VDSNCVDVALFRIFAQPSSATQQYSEEIKHSVFKYRSVSRSRNLVLGLPS
jgi:hypothetical protein